MPATTGRGVPYALPDDAVHDYPITSAALAKKLDPLLELAPNGGVAYTPAWTQDGGTALSVGQGTLVGAGGRVGGLGWFTVALVRGTGTNAGTAGYLFSLPPNLPPSSYRTIHGSGVVICAGAAIPVIVQAVSGTQVRLIRCKDEARIGHNTGAWAAGDSIAFTGFFQAQAVPVTP